MHEPGRESARSPRASDDEQRRTPPKPDDREDEEQQDAAAVAVETRRTQPDLDPRAASADQADRMPA